MNLNKDLLKKRFPNLTADQINDVLNMHVDDIPETSLMTDSQKFVSLLKSHLKDGDNITISADYDADGILSGTLFLRTLNLASELLGSKSEIKAYFPDRVLDGYGINPSQIKRLYRKYPKTNVVATTDNGIAAFDGASEVYRRGGKVMVSDHHLPRSDGSLPQAEALVDPNRLGDAYPFGGISGTTVIYKLMKLFYQEYLPNELSKVRAYLDYVGISVLSDIMPMEYENRVYVKETLKRFNGTSSAKPHYQLAAILQAANVKQPYDETAFGYYIGPVLNASSRVTGSPNDAAYLLQSQSKGEADSKVNFLVNVLNQKRKDLAKEAFEQAQKEIIDVEKQKIIIWRSDDIPAGIAGLVSGRLTEKYHRPSMVFAKVGHTYKGSGRSVTGVNLVEILQDIQKLGAGMESFGGHAAAAGMAVSESNWDTFSKIANDYAKKIKIVFKKPSPDFIVKSKALSIPDLEQLNKLKPFGNLFESPTFEVDDIDFTKISYMGDKKQHLKIQAGNLDVIQFNKSDDNFLNTVKNSHSARGSLDINEWRGKKRLTLLAEK